MLHVTMTPLFNWSSASVWDTVVWCASKWCQPYYLKLTMADAIIDPLYGHPPVKWWQQHYIVCFILVKEITSLLLTRQENFVFSIPVNPHRSQNGAPKWSWFCEESSLQHSVCHCDSSTCSLVETDWALVWNDPLCAVTLFLWDVKREAVEVAGVCNLSLSRSLSMCFCVWCGTITSQPCTWKGAGNEGQTHHDWVDVFFIRVAKHQKPVKFVFGV